MTIIFESPNRRVTIDLQGPDGNAFALLAYAKDFGKQLGLSKEKQSAISKEMRSSDYKNLVTVFDREFGTFCDLIAPRGF